jgi:hypothetical protein
MNLSSEFWALVQIELDAQRDPLEHAEILAWLENNPADLDAFASLRAVGIRLNQDLATLSRKPNPGRRLRSLALLAAALAVYLMLPEDPVEPGPVSPPLTAIAPAAGSPKPAASSKPVASLISIEHHRVENYAQTNFAPADPQSGAIVLSMSTSTRHTTL